MIIEVSESSQAGEARRTAMEYAQALGLEESRCGAAALTATEMATNLLKHAGSGHMLLDQVHENGRSGLRLIAVDRGPGIADVTKALRDGHSTAGSMGTGFGAMQRVADIFDTYTVPGAGTVIRTEFWQNKPTSLEGAGAIQIGVISEPIRGEDVCGDGWGVRKFADSLLLMVVDGLGHGVLAAEPAREAERILANAQSASMQDILRDTHDALRKTRGAAFAMSRIEPEKGLLSFLGVGNISASIVSPGASRSMASHNGTVGQQMLRVQEFTCPWSADSLLVMHSDGLSNRWDLERYPGIWTKHPSMVAALLHRDATRGRDDVTVLVAKTT